MTNLQQAKTIPQFALLVLNELTVFNNTVFCEKSREQAFFNLGIIYDQIACIARENREDK